MKDKKLKLGTVLFFCAAAAFSVSAADWWPFGKQQAAPAAKPAPAAPKDGTARPDNPTLNIVVDKAPLSEQTRLSTSHSPVIQKAAPGVVNIFSTLASKPSAWQPLLDDPMFRKFFGDRFGGGVNPKSRERKQHELGSGVIVTSDGYILTNNHVVEGAEEIKVAMADGKTEYSARLIGKDSKTDIAVLKVDARDLRAAVLGDSDHLQVGDTVLAIGNPFGVGQTVTVGIVSAVGRGNMHIADYEDFIQTDASINPGNSGGALVDAEGRVVGINTAIISRSGGNLGIGFAVPVNLAQFVMERIVKDGRVIRGYLGVTVQGVTSELQKAFKLGDSAGALVGEVAAGGSAEQAGLKVGDVIVEFDGRKVTDARQLRLLVSQTAPGRKIGLKALRDGQEKTFTAVLRELPADQAAAGEPGAGAASAGGILEGVELGELSAAIRRQLNAPDKLAGAVVLRIDPASPAYDAGLREGDVIQEIDRKPVRSAAEASSAAVRVKGGVLVRVWSGGASRFLVIERKD